MKAKSGGGIRSSKVVQVREGTRVATSARGVNPSGVSGLGKMRGNSVTERGPLPFKKEPLYGGQGPIAVPLGNTLTTNVGKGGPGAGRTVHRSGSQGMHGAPRRGEASTSPDLPATKPGRSWD
jgi:hypothetical protein